MLYFSRNKKLSVIIFFSNKFLFFRKLSLITKNCQFLNIEHIFLIILSQYKNYNDETSSSSLSSCPCILSNESSTIASSSPLINNFNVFHFFFFLNIHGVFYFCLSNMFFSFALGFFNNCY